MATVSAPAGRQKVVLHGVDWRTYSRLLGAFAEYPGVRLTYGRGVLEIMSPLLYGHENDGSLLGL